MQLVLNTVGLPRGDDFGAAYDVAAEHDIEWLELFHGINFADEDAEAALADVASHGLRVAAVDALSQLYLREPYGDRNRRLLSRQIDLAAVAGAPYVVTYFGHDTERDDPRAIADYAERLAPCLEQAEEAGLTILLENEFDAASVDPSGSDITRRPEAVRTLIETVDHPRFRTNFDAANYLFAGVEPFPYAYAMLEDVIAYVHVKDGHHGPPRDPARWSGTRDGEREHAWCPLGEGEVDWDGLLGALRTRGYSGHIALEPHSQPAHMAEAWQQGIAFVQERIG